MEDQDKRKICGMVRYWWKGGGNISIEEAYIKEARSLLKLRFDALVSF